MTDDQKGRHCGVSAPLNMFLGLEMGARAYWEQRARRYAGKGRGLRAVCSYGMPSFYNGYIHLTQCLALAPWLRVSPNTAVLEVGCGVGRWSRRLAYSGASVTGIDLAPTMVDTARQMTERSGLSERCHFLVADLAELALGKRFDRILGVTVLQHILDSERFQAAVERLAAHLAPGGRLVLLEVAPSHRVTRCDTAIFCARPTSAYCEAFKRVGLYRVSISGVDPAPFKSLFLPWYPRLPRSLQLPGLAAVTALSLPLDILAGRWMTRFSWHKVFVLSN